MFGLTIDGREPKALFDIFRASNVVHTRRDLDCGDFEVASDERVAVIIERKTWPDLVSSLTSQRLSDQASRIIDKCRETGARPVLLVEHARVLEWSAVTGNTSNKFVECALAKYALEGFSVVRTGNMEDTKNLVWWILDRCRAGKIPTFSPGFEIQPGGGKKFRKKDYGKPWEVMLTAVRGISKSKAKEISNKYTNATALAKALTVGEDLGIKGVGKKLCADMKEALIG